MRFILRFVPVAAVCAALVSCQNGGSNSGGSPYVSNYGSDGGYNPYPGQPGTMQSGGSYSPPPQTSAPPTYVQPPAPTPPSDPYAFNAGSPPSSAPRTSSSSTPRKSTASASKPKPKAPVKKSGSYKVVKGDTLYGIARKRGTTVAKIKAANGLSADLIKPGQTLKIP